MKANVSPLEYCQVELAFLVREHHFDVTFGQGGGPESFDSIVYRRPDLTIEVIFETVCLPVLHVYRKDPNDWRAYPIPIDLRRYSAEFADTNSGPSFSCRLERRWPPRSKNKALREFDAAQEQQVMRIAQFIRNHIADFHSV